MAMTSKQILDREFLELRAKILELAASMDRLDRADGQLAQDPRLDLLAKGIQILQQDEPERAERVQLLFSRQYESGWKKQFQIAE